MRIGDDEDCAQLHRSTARSVHDKEGAAELVGEGRLAKMVRAALTDPDDELWRYSIIFGGRTVNGDAILAYKDLADSLPRECRPLQSIDGPVNDARPTPARSPRKSRS